VFIKNSVIAISEAKKQSINKTELGFKVFFCKKSHFVDCRVVRFRYRFSETPRNDNPFLVKNP
jgi:hypothetical protein